jgi:1,4-dihydroxy-6-naphthoate synthase
MSQPRVESRETTSDIATTMSLAYSPCPNDTFMFGPIANGLIPSPSIDFDIELHDVQILNERVVEGIYDVSKVSFHAFLHARNEYTLLDAGAALGYGCGPIVVARNQDALNAPETSTIAVPGELTTANLLLHLWSPAIAHRRFMPYDRILPAVLAGDVDAGVIIHESRFTYADTGLFALVDLGAWWEEETRLPIPLGGIVARRSLGPSMAATLSDLIRDSITFSRKHPYLLAPYIRNHAQEISETVLRQHVDMFVNEFSLDIGETGRAAVDRLAEMAKGKVPGL